MLLQIKSNNIKFKSLKILKTKKLNLEAKNSAFICKICSVIINILKKENKHYNSCKRKIPQKLTKDVGLNHTSATPLLKEEMIGNTYLF